MEFWTSDIVFNDRWPDIWPYNWYHMYSNIVIYITIPIRLAHTDSCRSLCRVLESSCTLSAGHLPWLVSSFQSCATGFRHPASHIRFEFFVFFLYRLCMPWRVCGRNACLSHLWWLLREKSACLGKAKVRWTRCNKLWDNKGFWKS